MKVRKKWKLSLKHRNKSFGTAAVQLRPIGKVPPIVFLTRDEKRKAEKNCFRKLRAMIVSNNRTKCGRWMQKLSKKKKNENSSADG